MPVWGFADVADSKAEGVEAGKRVYGYYPASSHLVVRPDKADAAGFFDGTEHRTSLPSVYNHYVFTDADPGYTADTEDEQMLLRPLFATSFLLDDEFADEDFHGAETVVMSSSSSKTALAAAFLIARRDGPEVVGLTSPSRVGFVESTGTYGRVVPYDDIGSLGDGPAAYVDFSGDAGVRAAIHEHYGDGLVSDTAVGVTHWDKLGGADGLPGPAPTFFFAPARASKRSEDWGAEGLRANLAEAWSPFVDWAKGWLEITRAEGPEALERAYREFLDGDVDPAAGHVLTLG
jgi:hypothetical protein